MVRRGFGASRRPTEDPSLEPRTHALVEKLAPRALELLSDIERRGAAVAAVGEEIDQLRAEGCIRGEIVEVTRSEPTRMFLIEEITPLGYALLRSLGKLVE